MSLFQVKLNLQIKDDEMWKHLCQHISTAFNTREVALVSLASVLRYCLHPALPPLPSSPSSGSIMNLLKSCL